MSCDNCYNGCTESVSDKCVNYTGAAVPALGITIPTNLLCIENTLIEKVVSFLDGTGIDITINPSYYCSLVTQYLPGGTPTLLDVLTALVRAACNLQGQVVTIDEILSTLNAPYTVGCLDGVTSSSNTHDVVQAIITKLCTTVTNLTALTLDVNTNYVKIADLNGLIQSYLNSINAGTQQYTKMVPYTVVEYYGPLTNFDGTGAGLSSLGWNKVYLCNGENGTPDKRGRVGVGAIHNVPGGPLNPAVDPIYAGNPNYTFLGTDGANSVTLTIPQIPTHTHATTVTETPHSHFIAKRNSVTTGNIGEASSTFPIGSNNDDNQKNAYILNSNNLGPADVGLTNPVTTSVSVTNANVGGGGSHNNIQPVLATYYIMYIPS